jgi:hypothetical protein
MRRTHEAVNNGIPNGHLAYPVMPFVSRELSGDDDRTTVILFEQAEQVGTLFIGFQRSDCSRLALIFTSDTQASHVMGIGALRVKTSLSNQRGAFNFTWINFNGVHFRIWFRVEGAMNYQFNQIPRASGGRCQILSGGGNSGEVSHLVCPITFLRRACV